MPQLSTIIDVFLRRAGLSSGQKTALCDDLGAVPRTVVERLINDEGDLGILASDAGKILVIEGFGSDFAIDLTLTAANDFPAGQMVTLKNLTEKTANLAVHEDVTIDGGDLEIPPGGAAQIYKRTGGDFLWI
jgi:hypothetical protein